MNITEVSVVVVNWNTCNILRDCLRSVYSETTEVQFEVIVIDNASDDDSVEMIRSKFPQVVLIENSENRGFAAACNQGINISKGRYVLLLNSDTVVCDAAIEKTVRYADSHPKVAVVGCQVWKDQNTVQLTCFRFPSIANLFLRASGLSKIFKNNRLLGRGRMRWWQRDSERQVDVVSGMFTLVRGEAIEQVGLMDEDYFFYGEEVDWCYRFSKAGWKIMFWPGARIIHLHGGGQSSKKIPIKAVVQQQKSDLMFFKKHRGFVSYFFARLLLAILFSLKYCMGTITHIVTHKPCESTAYELEQKRALAAFKFCAFGIEPRESALQSVSSLFRRVVSIAELIFATIYSVFLPFLHKKPHQVILYYHSINKADVMGFSKQMAYLAKKCRVVKASEIMTSKLGGNNLLVAITFDDGFVGTIENVLPVLKKYGLVATIFVPTGNLGQAPQWPMPKICSDKNETIISEQQVRELDRDGFEVFSHTTSHPVLTDIKEDKLENEMLQSKQTLETIVGHGVLGVSYPNGVYNTKICEAAKSAGYQYGFTIEPYMADCSPSNLEIGRFSVQPKDGLLTFRLKVNGAYQATKYLRAMKKLFVGS